MDLCYVNLAKGFPGGASGKACMLYLHANAEDHKRHGEDPLEEGMATHPSIVAGEIP